MPRGPQGVKRLGDVVGATVMVAEIATGEVEEKLQDPSWRKARQAGGGKRAECLSPNPPREGVGSMS